MWKAVDIAFLGVVLFHALNGTYAVITDIDDVQPYRRALAWAGLIVGLAFFVYGTQTILAFRPGA
jgi:succinate dehydrogenase hydrophobic anchor subunit